MKRYVNAAFLYAVLAMAGGVFYREFTKLNGFSAKTTLGVVHTHYFLLGMVFFLLLLLLERSFSFTGAKTGRDPGAGDGALLRHERGYLRRRRDRAYPAGRQPGASAAPDQAQRILRRPRHAARPRSSDRGRFFISLRCTYPGSFLSRRPRARPRSSRHSRAGRRRP